MASLTHKIAAAKRFEFSSAAHGDANPFDLVSMEGYEAISQPFRFELVLVSDNADIDFDAMLRHPATLKIFTQDGSRHAPYHGILAEFEQLHRADGYVFYRAVLVPRLWRLSLFRVSDVYLNEQVIPDIIEGVLKASRLTNADYALAVNGAYRKRSFVCQYEESNLAFISRWMEKEGMHYYFDHDGGVDKMTVVDRRESLPAKVLQVNYRPVDELDTGVAADSVQAFIYRQKPLPHRVLLQEYNYRKAHLNLLVEAIVDEGGIGDVMIYGENFRDAEEGKRYAALRAEEIICGARTYFGESTAIGLRSGGFIELAHHYRASFNARYLVTEIRHQGSQAGALLAGIRSPYSEEGKTTSYGNSFQAIPAGVQFRAARTTPWPRVAGTMNARVDSEGSGELAEIDEFGQYKVQLPFDRPGKNANKGSARVRMASPYSGDGHGMHFPLYKGSEVLLSFTDGDPDQPVIMAAVPNSENRNIINHDNATDNGISTKGGNKLYMSDAKGKEAMWMHSPYHNSSIGIGSIDPKGGGSLAFLTAGSSESITIGNNYGLSVGASTSVSVGVNTSLSAAMNTSMSVGASTSIDLSGSLSWAFPGGRSMSVNDSEGFIELSTTSGGYAAEKYAIGAGQTDGAKLEQTAIDSMKRSLRIAVGASIAANLAISASAQTAMIETREKEPEQPSAEDAVKQKKDTADKVAKKKQEYIDNGEKDPDVAQEKAERDVAKESSSYTPADGKMPFGEGGKTKWAIGASVLNFGLSAIATTTAVLKARSLMKELTVKSAGTKYVGTLTLDKDGAQLGADFNMPGMGPHPLTISKLGLTDAGFSLNSEKMADAVSIEGNFTELKLSSKKKVTVDATTDVDIAALANVKITAGPNAEMSAKTQLKMNVATTAMEMEAATLTLESAGSKVQFAADGLSLEGPGNARIGLSATELIVAAPAAGGQVQLNAVGFSATGQLIKLG
ncbi:type VI secretion system Vgr family protein [Herbaspirillum robiniae]|uniref:Type VI secretion system tip protein VgrG n=1 Tax=Herbaspirillum robiniae TaxID=2014887 RepID=A0ABX2M1R2_9BURK|nr:type VI secretion system tip protein TssI/VgrG [Herbaspirillum robiniae]NUU02191.1 type VI secretion system tip protein VgrG [Herbaspirillum robiniae]